jgi:hypothetical protein
MLMLVTRTICMFIHKIEKILFRVNMGCCSRNISLRICHENAHTIHYAFEFAPFSRS